MADPDSTYAPRSPDLSAFDTSGAPAYHTNNHPQQHASAPGGSHHYGLPVQPGYSAGGGFDPHHLQQQQQLDPNFAQQQQQPQAYQYQQQQYTPNYYPELDFSLDPTGSGGGQFAPHQQGPYPDLPQAAAAGMPPGRGRRSKHTATVAGDGVITEEPEAAIPPEEEVDPSGGPSRGIDVKTKFPVARIKRIMQADEDVGKVAQATPVAVSKALELFMISIVCQAADEARARNSKRVTASHLKQVIVNENKFDFLREKVAKIPDAPPPSAAAASAGTGVDGGSAERSDQEGVAEENVGGPPAKRKRRAAAAARKKIASGEDEY